MTDREKQVLKNRVLQLMRLIDEVAPERSYATVHFFNNHGGAAISVAQKDGDETRYIMQSYYYQDGTWADYEDELNWFKDSVEKEGGKESA